MRYHTYYCVPTRYCQVQNAGMYRFTRFSSLVVLTYRLIQIKNLTVCTNVSFTYLQAMPGLYKGVGDGFRSINAAEGLRGFTLVSNNFKYVPNCICFKCRDGSQPLSDTPCKDSVNSASTKFSRMFIETQPVVKTQPLREDSEPLDSLSHQLAPSSLLIACFAQWKL